MKATRFANATVKGPREAGKSRDELQQNSRPDQGVGVFDDSDAAPAMMMRVVPELRCAWSGLLLLTNSTSEQEQR